MTTVQTLIEAGYLRSSANDPGKLAWDPELIGHLNRVYQRAWSLIARARPDAFSSSAAVTFTGSPPAAPLPASIIDILRLQTATGAPVWLIPINEQFRGWHLAPAVYRQGQSIVSRNQGGDPTSGQTLTAFILDAPAALTALPSVLDTRWPSRHEQLLVDLLGVYLSTKDDGRSAIEQQKMVAELTFSISAFVNDFALPPEAIEWLQQAAERTTSAGAPS